MSFFRRMFNNSEDEPEEQTSTVQADDSLNNAAAPEQVTEKPVEIGGKDDDTLPVAPDDAMTGEEDYQPKGVTVKLPEEPVGVTRPLPQEPSMSLPVTGHILFGQASDTGMVRNNNQDSALSFFFASDSVDNVPDFGTFVVADGMGGHKEGEKASALTARTIITDLFNTIYLPMLEDEEMGSERMTITEALIQSVKRANELVRIKVQDGGTTVTAVVVVGDQAYIGHVGDSRAYLIRQEGAIEQITRDHSVVQRLIELDQLTPEEAETHDQRNVLYRAIGQNEDVEVDILRRRITSNSYILLCSDGLWGMMDNQTIADIVLSSDDPQIACNRLIAQGNTNGGTDNITAILLKMPSS